MAKYSLQDGQLFADGVATEMEVYNHVGNDARIGAKGTGSCKIYGKLTREANFKPLSLVRLKDFAVVDTITDNEIYACDLTGFHTVKADNVSGFTSVWINIMGGGN